MRWVYVIPGSHTRQVTFQIFTFLLCLVLFFLLFHWLSTLSFLKTKALLNLSGGYFILIKEGRREKETLNLKAPQVILATVFPLLSPRFANTEGRPGEEEADFLFPDPRDLKRMLSSQLPMLAEWERASRKNYLHPAKEEGNEALPVPISSPELEPEEPKAPSGAPLILVYNTHNSETYLPEDKTTRLEGKNAGVAQVANTLASILNEECGVPTLYVSTVHDHPNFADSYRNSAQTVKELMGANPSLKIIVDVHRDAGIGSPLTAEIEGQRAAQLLFVVGTDSRLPHPQWRENWKFAEQLAAKTNTLYPGLVRGVRIQEGRYNQHLHPRAVLVEVGTVENSLAEAKASTPFLARALKEVLKEIE